MSDIPLNPEIVAVTRPDGAIDIVGRDVHGERVLVSDYQLGDEVSWMVNTGGKVFVYLEDHWYSDDGTSEHTYTDPDTGELVTKHSEGFRGDPRTS